MPARKILVVEDDPTLRKLLELHMGIFGHESRLAENGAEGLEIAKEWHPDLVLTDIMMPIVSGLTLCRELRKLDEFAHTPVVLLTARTEDDSVRSVMALGGITFMNKPFDANVLKDTIERMIVEVSSHAVGMPGS